jgi:hypothetical protein
MKIVWDEPKRIANIANHEMDFADLDKAFFESSVIVPAKSDWATVGQNQASTGSPEGTEIDRWVKCRRNSSRAARLHQDGLGSRSKSRVDGRTNGQGKPFAEAFPDLAASIRRGRGPNKAPNEGVDSWLNCNYKIIHENPLG